MAGVDPQAPMYGMQTGEERAKAAFAGPRFQMVLMGSFAGIALLLSMFGLYGVLSYAVARRRRELGVRTALGAGRGEVLRLVFRSAVQLLAAGLILGLGGAIATGRLLGSMLYGVRPGVPMILASACGLMIRTGLAAACVPAAKVASVNPVQVLRRE